MQDDKKKFSPRVYVCSLEETIEYAGEAINTTEREPNYLSLEEHEALTAKLVEALEFYAESGWNWHYCKKEFVKVNKCYAASDEVNQDGGELARAALKEFYGKE